MNICKGVAALLSYLHIFVYLYETDACAQVCFEIFRREMHKVIAMHD